MEVTRHRHSLWGGRQFAGIALVFTVGQPLLGQFDNHYRSPGFQIGHTFGGGNFVSAQLSIGYYNNNFEGTSFFPGFTVGVRLSKNRRIVYIDGQVSAMIVGTGLGAAFIFSGKGNSWGYRFQEVGIRFKLYAGFYGLVTMDRLFIKDNPVEINLGLMAVQPAINRWPSIF